MVVEWFLGVARTVFGGVIDALPKFTVPDWLTGAHDMVQGVLDKVGALGYWIPFGLAFTVAATVMGVLLLGFGVKVARIALSFLTAGGGSAG